MLGKAQSMSDYAAGRDRWRGVEVYGEKEGTLAMPKPELRCATASSQPVAYHHAGSHPRIQGRHRATLDIRMPLAKDMLKRQC